MLRHGSRTVFTRWEADFPAQSLEVMVQRGHVKRVGSPSTINGIVGIWKESRDVKRNANVVDKQVSKRGETTIVARARHVIHPRQKKTIVT
eukprot:scaffold307_cov162-Amphora_coffeaeformis.AAC.6